MAAGFFQYLPAGICLPLLSGPTTSELSLCFGLLSKFQSRDHTACHSWQKFGILGPELYSQTTDTDLGSGVARRLMVSLVET